jgi:hypothetical protein
MAISTIGGAASGSRQPKSRTFSTSGVWTVPTGVTSVKVTCVGAGGTGYTSQFAGGGGGYISGIVDLTNVTSVPVTVGAAPVQSGGNGGDSSFGSLLFAQGGRDRLNGGATTTTPDVLGTDYVTRLVSVTSPHAFMPHGVNAGNYHMSVNGQNFTNGTGPVWTWRSKSRTFVNGNRPHMGNFNGVNNKFYELGDRIIWFNDSYINDQSITGSPNPISGFWFSKAKSAIDAVAANGSFTWEAMTGFPPTMTSRTLAYGEVYIVGTAMYYASPSDGIWRTTDGVAWTQVCAVNPASGSKLGLYIDPQGRIVTAVNTSGTAVVFYRTTDANWTAWTNLGTVFTTGTPSYILNVNAMGTSLRYDVPTDRWILVAPAYYLNQTNSSNFPIYMNVGQITSNAPSISYWTQYNFNDGGVNPATGSYFHMWWNSDNTVAGHLSKNLYVYPNPLQAAQNTSPASTFFMTIPQGDAFLALVGMVPGDAHVLAIEGTGSDSGASAVFLSAAGNKGHEGRQFAAGGAGGPGIYYDGSYRIGGQGIDGFGWGSSDYNQNGTTAGSGSYNGLVAKNGVVILEWWE